MKKVPHRGFLSCQSAIMALHSTASMMQCVSATIGNTTPTKHVKPVLPVIFAGLLLPAQLMATSVDCVIGQSSECVLWCSGGWDGDQCVDTVIDTDIVAGSSGNRCPGHC